MIKSLKARGGRLADSEEQVLVLEATGSAWVPFQQKLELSGLYPLKPLNLQIFQVNLGKMCNQVCKHCHVDAGPDRKEIMSREIMSECLQVLANNPQLHIVDLTGGAPEMNPNFRWFVEELTKLGRHVMVRCNLTIIMANKKYYDLPIFYRQHGVEVISSLPFYTADRTDKQRGIGVFDDSIKALKLLNEQGYGKAGTGLVLNLVYNPAGAFLPPSQAGLEKEYKQALNERYGIAFNSLFAITNLPVSRYLDYLIESGNYEQYMKRLVNAYNPAAAAQVMCRNTISIGWDGYLYDCDFNQMLDLKVSGTADHISTFHLDFLNSRSIKVGQHCYGCTAGAGSSCGGAVT
jgi:radical SAM/Cys-rich protein